MASKFKPGDIVRTKVGGPHMVVDALMGAGPSMYCIWFAGAKRNRETFTDSSLEIVPPAEVEEAKKKK
jgi:uncharacterized protein YodC (DUF2158 family)